MKLCKEINGKKIVLIPRNSKTLELQVTGTVADICYSEDLDRDITSITITDNYRITKHGSIKIPFQERDVLYEINHIFQVDKGKFLLLTHLKNKTSIYMLPALGLLNLTSDINKLDNATKQEISHYCHNTYLINAYINYKNKKLLNLVYRFSNHSTYKLLESCIIKHNGFIQVIDGYKKDEYVSFEIELPKKYWGDVDSFLKGRYSELSPDLKKEILKFHKATRKSKLYQVLHKDTRLKEFLEKTLAVKLSPEQELESIPDKSQEFLEHD